MGIRTRTFVLALSMILALTGITAASPSAFASTLSNTTLARRDYTSYFAGTSLAGSGWTNCSTPITWSVDVRAFTRRQARNAINGVATALGQWAFAAGVALRYIGRVNMQVVPQTNQLVPADGSEPLSRHIYIAFENEGVAPMLVDNVIGYAMPSRVLPSSRQIITGVAVFRAQYVRTVHDALLKTGLYLHELGHVFGLGHATHPVNVMTPVVHPHSVLGPGDIRGVRKMTRPCVQ